MSFWFQRPMVLLAAFALFGFVVVGASDASAKPKSVQSEAEWIEYDEPGQTIKVKIKKPGRGKAAKGLKRNKPASFNVKAEGSVLSKTTVAINGRKGELTDIPEGKTVLIYWRPDAENEGERFARKIDVIFSADELDERYPDQN